MVYAAQDNYFIFRVLKKWYVWFYSVVVCLEKQKPSKWYARESSTCVFITKEEAYHTEKHNNIQERMLFSMGFPFRLVFHELNDLFKKIRVESKRKRWRTCWSEIIIECITWSWKTKVGLVVSQVCLTDCQPSFVSFCTYIHTSSGWCLGVVDCNEFCYLTEALL